MMSKPLVSLPLALLLLLISIPVDSRAAEEGIFADFQTSLGSFTAELDSTHSPKAVASFLALATGERPWLEETTGAVRSHSFHRGLTFHRVIAGFMIQAGSPNAQGTDGPGYVFPDEFQDSPLRHDGPGVLSMANSGPDSNGSQFFVTVTNTPWLDGVHTIFGRVVEGLPVVQAISQVATDDDDHPLVPVVLDEITIRRVGTAAEAFDIHAQELPTVSREPLRAEALTNAVRLSYTNRLDAEFWLGESGDLGNWTPSRLGIDIAPPVTDSLVHPTVQVARYYTLARVQYPHSTRAPRLLNDRALTLEFDGGLGTLAILFDAAGGGSYTYGASPGTVTAYDWSQGIYRGSLWPIRFSALVPMTLDLRFADDRAGSFVGTAYPDPGAPFAVSGRFALAASPP